MGWGGIRVGVLLGAVAVLGSGCSMPPPAPSVDPGPGDGVLAVAYVNVNGVDGFHPDADVLVAKLLDTNGDGIASAGDTAITQSYPTTFDGLPVADFSSTQHTVTDAFDSPISSMMIDVAIDGGGLRWIGPGPGHPPELEGYAEMTGEHTSLNDWNDAELVLGDCSGCSAFGPGLADRISVSATAPSAPPTPVADTNRLDYTDNPFIDVDLFI